MLEGTGIPLWKTPDGILVSEGKMRNICSFSYPSTIHYVYMAGGPYLEMLTKLPYFWAYKLAAAYIFILQGVGSLAFSLLLSCKAKNVFERNFKVPVGKIFPLLSWLFPRLVPYLQILFGCVGQNHIYSAVLYARILKLRN